MENVWCSRKQRCESCTFLVTPKSCLVYFSNGMQEELECSSSHLRPAQTAGAFQSGCRAHDDQVTNSGRNKALYFSPGTAFPLAQPGRKADPFTPVLFQSVSLGKESSSLHSLRTPFPTN